MRNLMLAVCTAATFAFSAAAAEAKVYILDLSFGKHASFIGDLTFRRGQVTSVDGTLGLRHRTYKIDDVLKDGRAFGFDYSILTDGSRRGLAFAYELDGRKPELAYIDLFGRKRPAAIEGRLGSDVFRLATKGSLTPELRIASAVPEPSTWLLMFAGIGAIGWTLRRDRKGRLDETNWSGASNGVAVA